MATHQPPPRPWFRFASLARPTPAPARPPTPASRPTSQPRPPLIRPTVSQMQSPTPAPRSTSQLRPPLIRPTFSQMQSSAPAPQPSVLPTAPLVASSSALPPSRTTESARPLQVTPSPVPQKDSLAPPTPAPTPPPIAISPPPTVQPAVSPSPNHITSSVPISPTFRTSNRSPQARTTHPYVSSLAPSSPNARASISSSPILPYSPTPKPVSTSPVPVTADTPTVPHNTVTPGVPTTSPSSNIIKPPPETQLAKIPPVAEQKTVLAHEIIEKPTFTSPRTSKEAVRGGQVSQNQSSEIALMKWKQGNGNHEKLFDSEETGQRVLIVAGENEGAIMKLMRSSHETDGHQKRSDSCCIGKQKGRQNKTEKSPKKSIPNLSPLPLPSTNAFINSNVQGVNNSILHNCSCTVHDPGVHLSLSIRSKANARCGH